MMQIKIADTQFAHGTGLGSGDLKLPLKYFEWYRGQENINDMIVITESMFHKVDEFQEKIKIAWLIEPMTINSESYKWIKENWHKFDYILTHNHVFKEGFKMLTNGEKFADVIWYPFGGCWIYPEQRKIYPKTKLISIIASNKRDTAGHRFRHEVIATLGDKVDVYGNGYKFVENKLEALQDYKFSIVIENEATPGFFTEKVIDCFKTGTVPIYWGDPFLRSEFQFFNFETLDRLVSLIDTIISSDCDGLTRDITSLSSGIEANFTKADKYVCPEDWLYENFFMKYEPLKNQLIKHNIL